MTSGRLPLLLLLAYALAFSWHALGGGLLIVDDHPGQLYRLAHVVNFGPWPWRLNPGWWAGYAELQYYPPGFSYLGAALHAATLGAVGPERVYQGLLWIVYILPGVTTYALLARVLGSGWLALPGAFVALALSADSRSGVEEGLRWGLVAARLGWSLLPCLALALQRSRAAFTPALILAAIVITHPAHAPAGFLLVGLATTCGFGPRAERIRRAAVLVLVAVGLAAFWVVPLFAHLDMTLPLAWGDARLSAIATRIGGRPLLLMLAAATAVTCWALARSNGARDRWLAAFAPAMAVMIALDALIAQPLGIHWLPADRLVDSFLLGLIVDASMGLRAVWRRWPRLPDWALAAGAIALCLALASPGRPEPTLTLWPRREATEWTREANLAAGVRLDGLWAVLRRSPPGRVLFVRSSVPLAYRPGWWRPHSHVTSLAPLRAEREIINGTFTHPSPIAALVYTGSAAHRPITELVEQRDGVTLFGRPLEALTADTFNRLAARLRIAAVVALDEDANHLDFLKDNPAFANRPVEVGPFLVWNAMEPRPGPVREGGQRWRLPATAGANGWVSTGLAYSPLWSARAGDRRLALRRDDLGLLEVQLPPSASEEIELSHDPGLAEWVGVGISALTVLAVAREWRRRRQTSGS